MYYVYIYIYIYIYIVHYIHINYIYIYIIICIREADNGSAVVAMSRERYIAEANRQLSDTDVYQQVSSNVFFDVIEEVNDILSRLQKSGVITEDMAAYAVPVDSKPARFYILPKVHKSGCPEDLLCLLLDHLQKVCQSW